MHEVTGHINQESPIPVWRRLQQSTCAFIEPPNRLHYNDVIMGTIASEITSLTIVFSTVYSEADQRKHESSASLAFVRGIHRGPVNSPHKWPVTRKIIPFDDVIMWEEQNVAQWPGLRQGHCHSGSRVAVVAQCRHRSGWKIVFTIIARTILRGGPFCIHSGNRLPVDSPHKGPVIRNAFPCHDAITQLHNIPHGQLWCKISW